MTPDKTLVYWLHDKRLLIGVNRMMKVKPRKTYEVTWLEAGVTEHWSGTKLVGYFGKDEAHEMLNGYSPNIVVVEL